jgi:serine/threonine protein kinase
VDGTLKQGIFHGDIKPHNIFLDDNTDTVKLSDFMIPDVQAFLHEEEHDFQDLDINTAEYGTPGYMSPEQAAGRISPQADIYSLGITMFQFVTGYSPTSLLGAKMLSHNISPQEDNPFVPAWLGSLIVKATQQVPFRRFQTVNEMIKVFQENRVQSNATALFTILSRYPRRT